MYRQEALEILEKHQAWRRYHSDDINDEKQPAQQSPSKIGEAIDIAIELLKEVTR